MEQDARTAVAATGAKLHGVCRSETADVHARRNVVVLGEVAFDEPPFEVRVHQPAALDSGKTLVHRFEGHGHRLVAHAHVA